MDPAHTHRAHTPDADRDWPAGDLIRDAREARGMSLTEAAGIAGLAVGSWWSIENGLRAEGGEYRPANPRSTNLARAADAVGLNPTTVLRAAGRDPRVITPRRGSPSVTERELSHRVSRLTSEQRDAIVALIDTMLTGKDDDVDPPRGGAISYRNVAPPQQGQLAV